MAANNPYASQQQQQQQLAGQAVRNPYAAALAQNALRDAASATAPPADASALAVELDRLRIENDALRNRKLKPRTSLTDIMSWSDARAVWTMRVANMGNGCCFIGGGLASFLLVEASEDTAVPLTYTRVVLALYMLCVCGPRPGAARAPQKNGRPPPIPPPARRRAPSRPVTPPTPTATTTTAPRSVLGSVMACMEITSGYFADMMRRWVGMLYTYFGRSFFLLLCVCPAV